MSGTLFDLMTHAFADELDAATSRIIHCVGQLTDAQVWWRLQPDRNAIGNLILHLTGNVKQLIVCGVGGERDDRDRPAEFAARDVIPKASLLAGLTEMVERAKGAISGASLEDLCRILQVRDYQWTGMQAIVRSVAHFRGHTQEIIHQTRTILGDRYQFAGQR